MVVEINLNECFSDNIKKPFYHVSVSQIGEGFVEGIGDAELKKMSDAQYLYWLLIEMKNKGENDWNKYSDLCDVWNESISENILNKDCKL